MALAPQGDGLAVVDTGGDVHLNGPALADAAAAVTVGAGLVDDLAGAPALLAGSLALHDAKGRPLGLGHGAGAAAVGAHLRRGAVGAAVAFAGGAGFAAVHRHGFLAAEGGLREVHGHAGPGGVRCAAAGRRRSRRRRSCRKCRPGRRSRSRLPRIRRPGPRHSWGPPRQSRTGRISGAFRDWTAPRWPR